MINLLVDEGYAFDYLSILQVKQNNNCRNNYEQVYQSIMSQIPNMSQILESQEYQQMIQANQLTFELVDKARYGDNQITAKQVDEANMLRYNCKCKLQQRFFNTEVTESKT